MLPRAYRSILKQARRVDAVPLLRAGLITSGVSSPLQLPPLLTSLERHLVSVRRSLPPGLPPPQWQQLAVDVLHWLSQPVPRSKRDKQAVATGHTSLPALIESLSAFHASVSPSSSSSSSCDTDPRYDLHLLHYLRALEHGVGDVEAARQQADAHDWTKRVATMNDEQKASLLELQQRVAHWALTLIQSPSRAGLLMHELLARAIQDKDVARMLLTNTQVFEQWCSAYYEVGQWRALIALYHLRLMFAPHSSLSRSSSCRLLIACAHTGDALSATAIAATTAWAALSARIHDPLHELHEMDLDPQRAPASARIAMSWSPPSAAATRTNVPSTHTTAAAVTNNNNNNTSNLAAGSEVENQPDWIMAESGQGFGVSELPRSEKSTGTTASSCSTSTSTSTSTPTQHKRPPSTMRSSTSASSTSSRYNSLPPSFNINFASSLTSKPPTVSLAPFSSSASTAPFPSHLTLHDELVADACLLELAMVTLARRDVAALQHNMAKRGLIHAQSSAASTSSSRQRFPLAFQLLALLESQRLMLHHPSSYLALAELAACLKDVSLLHWLSRGFHTSKFRAKHRWSSGNIQAFYKHHLDMTVEAGDCFDVLAILSSMMHDHVAPPSSFQLGYILHAFLHAPSHVQRHIVPDYLRLLHAWKHVDVETVIAEADNMEAQAAEQHANNNSTRHEQDNNDSGCE